MTERLLKTKEAVKSPESKETLVVKKIYQLTHPDHDSGRFGKGELREKHEELASMWDMMIDHIAAEPNSILFYIPTYRQKEFQLLAKKRAGEELTPADLEKLGQNANMFERTGSDAIERDLNRIVAAKARLGRRFIALFTHKVSEQVGAVTNKQILETSSMFEEFRREQKRLKAILTNNGLEIEHPMPIYCFGEYTEYCVKNEIEKLAALLGFQGSQPHVIPELSLSVQDPDVFHPMFKKKSGKK